MCVDCLWTAFFLFFLNKLNTLVIFANLKFAKIGCARWATCKQTCVALASAIIVKFANEGLFF